MTPQIHFHFLDSLVVIKDQFGFQFDFQLIAKTPFFFQQFQVAFEQSSNYEQLNLKADWSRTVDKDSSLKVHWQRDY
jgi:hypothetical protein